NHYHECIWCHQSFDTAEHTFGDPVVTVHPTLTTKGTYKYTCTVCSYEKNEDIPEGDHVPEFVERIEPTCTERGYDIYRCKACGETVYHNYVNALSHDVTLVERTEPTCTEEGVERHYHCERCGLNFSNPEATEPMDDITIAPLGHSWKTIWSKDDNYHWHECSVCGEKKDIAAHSYDQRVTDNYYKQQDATCTEPARYFYSCVCGEKGTETFDYGDPKGHTLTHHDAIDSTCTVQGNIEYWSCSVCNKNFSDAQGMNEITGSIMLPYAEHVFTNNAFDVTELGHKRICDVCHQSIGDYESHSAETCHNSDYHWDRCSVCHYQMTGMSRHEWTHLDNKNVCLECGMEMSDPTSGGGFEVDSKDKTPDGYLMVEAMADGWIFKFVNTKPDYPPNKYIWFVNNAEVPGENTDSFHLTNQGPKSHLVMCVFMNDSGVGSASESVTGF
ncbi:MAG: hypothetical protein ACI4NM_11910, partial [Bullifex sp.]